MIDNDGRVYKGGWINSSKERIGMLSWPDGPKYWATLKMIK